MSVATRDRDHLRKTGRRRPAAVVALVTLAAFATTSGLVASRTAAAVATPVTVATPRAVPITDGCHDRVVARVTLEVPAGGGYEVNLGGWDADGHSLNGHETADELSGGTHTVPVDTQMCGWFRTPGRATLKIDVYLWDAEGALGDTRVTAYTQLKNLTWIPLRKVSSVQRRGVRVTLGGRPALRGLFPDSSDRTPLRRAGVRVYFRPVGGTWHRVTRTSTSRRGAWEARVRVRRTGDWQARYAGTPVLMPDRSPIRRIRVR